LISEYEDRLANRQKDYDSNFKSKESEFMNLLNEKDKIINQKQKDFDSLSKQLNEIELYLKRIENEGFEKDKKLVVQEAEINSLKTEMIKAKANFEKLSQKLEAEFKDKNVIKNLFRNI
jgi:chromosome segregation ATPase